MGLPWVLTLVHLYWRGLLFTFISRDLSFFIELLTLLAGQHLLGRHLSTFDSFRVVLLDPPIYMQGAGRFPCLLSVCT